MTGVQTCALPICFPVTILANSSIDLPVSTAVATSYTYDLVSVAYQTLPNCVTAITGSATVTIGILDDPSFSYDASSYCSNLTNPTPVITGLSGGTFAGSNGLFLNASTGMISLASSLPGGPYTVSYTTNGSCPNTSSVLVSITQSDNPSFSGA